MHLLLVLAIEVGYLQVTLNVQHAASSYNSDENRQVSSWQQWRLVMKKNALLMARDTSSTLCISVAPALIILAISALILLSPNKDWDPTLGTSGYAELARSFC